MMNELTLLVNGRYHLHEKIGQGGMGIVHRATDRLTGEIVALKQVFLPVEQIMFNSRPVSQTNRELRLALAHEFQTLAGLRHPNIISVLDYGFDENRKPFFTMSYLEGAETILAAGNGRSLPQKVTLLLQTLEALAYLHRRGILHRDLKPDNVLVVGDTVRVLDFGLAAAKEQATDSVGSWLYMAPEVLLGRPASEASDLYAVGVLAYRLLAGTHPFNIYAEDVVGEILEGEPDWRKVDASVQVVIRTLLAKKPENRYQTAVATSTALAHAIGLPETAETAVIRESYLQAATFIGRKTEMAQLTEALTQAKKGWASIWLVGGESGVGKSRLLNELRTYALVTGWQVLTGQAIAEGGLPYHLWQQIIPRLALVTELNDLEISILQEIVPSLTRLLGRTVPPIIDIEGKERQERLVLTLVDVLKRQTRPTLLILEDLQWAHESLTPLKRMLSVLQQMSGIIAIGTYRHDERPNLPNMLSGAQNILLERLSDTEIAQLSRAMLGERANNPDLVPLLTQETEGNTFFMVEVMRALAEEAGALTKIGQMALPREVFTSGIETLMLRRIQQVPAHDLPLLQLAAVAGRQLDTQLLATIAVETNMGTWLQRITETSVLMVQDDQWLFSHDKLRQTILAQLSPNQRRDNHRQIATALEAVYPEDTRYQPLLLEHWQQAGDEEKELSYIHPVASRLVSTGNYDRAYVLLNRGLALLPPIDERRITLLNEQATAYWLRGHYAEAKEVALQANALAQQVSDKIGLSRSLTNLGIAIFYQGEYASAYSYHQQSLAIGQEIGDQAIIARCFMNLGVVAYYLEGITSAYSYNQQSLAINQQMGNQFGVARSLTNLGLLAYFQGDYATAYDYAQQALIIDRAIGNQLGLANQFNNLGKIATSQADYVGADHYYQQSLVIMQRIGNQGGTANTYTELGILCFEQGHYEQAISHLQQARYLKLAINSLAQMGEIYGFLALSQVALGTYEAALQTALDHFELQKKVTVDNSYSLMYLAVAQLLGTLEEIRIGLEAMDNLTTLTQLPATPLAYFESALTIAKAQHIRLRVLITYGQFLMRKRQVVVARTYLKEAQEIARTLRLAHKLRQAEGLLFELTVPVEANVRRVEPTAVSPTPTTKETHD